jgi:predicted metalloprotease
MKWKGRRQSTNIEDRRGQAGPGMGKGRFSPLITGPLIKILFSKTGLVIVGIFLVVSFMTGNNPLTLLGELIGGGESQVNTSASYQPSAEEEILADFCATVLADTEDTWNILLENYREPTLVLFTNSVSSACGLASSATGPFYCPGDEKLYLDLGFFREMEDRLNAPGDFAQAYVIAHEVGHHIQKITGIMDQMQDLRGRLSEKEYNQHSVKLELQADFLAGVWAHHTQNMNQILDEGDLEEALNAAFEIGDDRLQKKSTGHVMPDSFTHGTSKQRMYWFKKGYDTGDLAQGDTFSDPSL